MLHSLHHVHRGPKPGPVLSVSQDLDAYKFMKRRGSVALCIGCGNKTLEVEEYVLKREEQDWWPNTNDDGTKSWRISQKRPQYYHALRACILNRNANFNPNMIEFTAKVTPNARTLLTALGVIF